MTFTVAPIVEGHGDVAAVPALLRRICPELRVARPVRFPRNRLVDPPHLARAGQIAAANLADRGAVLLVIDADEDCAAKLGPRLQNTLEQALPHRLCRVAIAVREFEGWIVGGDTAYAIDDPDRAGALKRRIAERRGLYKETVDQPKLIAAADLVRLESRSRSFRRLLKVIGEFRTLAMA